MVLQNVVGRSYPFDLLAIRMCEITPKVLYGKLAQLPRKSFHYYCERWEIKDVGKAMLFLDHLSARVKPDIRTKFWEDRAIVVGVDKYILWMWTVASQFTPYPDHRFAMPRATDNLDDYYLLNVMRKYCVREDASSMERLATECFGVFQKYKQFRELVLLSHLVNQAQEEEG